MAFRFGKLDYNLTDDVIREVGRRGGVIGVIACKHYTESGLRARPQVKTFEDSMELVYAHIDRIAQVTGSHDHAAIGSDPDGLIKPALPGLEHLGRMRQSRTRWPPSTAPRWRSRSPAETCSPCCAGLAVASVPWAARS